MDTQTQVPIGVGFHEQQDLLPKYPSQKNRRQCQLRNWQADVSIRDTVEFSNLQAAEAIKLLIGIPCGLSGKLLFVNALEMNFMNSELSKDPSCCVCGAPPCRVAARAPVCESQRATEASLKRE